MAAVTTRDEAIRKMAEKGWYGLHGLRTTGAPTTSGVQASNYANPEWQISGLSTFASSLVSLMTPGSAPGSLGNFVLLADLIYMGTTGKRGLALAWVYEIGTIDLTATGDRFTHHAATFPLLRTQFGVANQPIAMLPLVAVTTATTVTAPAFVLKTAGGAAGYKNQDGSSVVGTKTFTFPAAATALESEYFLRLEQGDSSVQDITATQVTTAGSAGAAKVYGVEHIAFMGSLDGGTVNVIDALYGGLAATDVRPAVATSGTANAYLSVMNYQAAGAATSGISLVAGFLNT